MYIAHIRTIMQENFINDLYKNRAQFLQNLIDSYVQNDTNKFYTYNDFTTNLTNQVSLVSSICPGIFQLMDERSNYLSNYFGFDGAPQFVNNFVQPINFSLGDNLTFNSEVVETTTFICFIALEKKKYLMKLKCLMMVIIMMEQVGWNIWLYFK